MNKYRGKYRVVCEFSIDTLEPIKESTYIFCANGGEIYRYNDNTLAYYRNSILVKSLLEKLDNANVNYINKAIGNGETLIYFDESDLDKTIDIFHIRTSGVNIAPYSIRNLHLFKWYKENKEYYDSKGLPKKREMSEEQKQNMRETLKKARETRKKNQDGVTQGNVL